LLSPDEVDEQAVASRLASADLPDPDLLIRTSGELRISNFFLYQLAYTELYFTNTLWPDFREREFLQALEAYQLRERRFGAVAAGSATRRLRAANEGLDRAGCAACAAGGGVRRASAVVHGVRGRADGVGAL